MRRHHEVGAVVIAAASVPATIYWLTMAATAIKKVVGYGEKR